MGVVCIYRVCERRINGKNFEMGLLEKMKKAEKVQDGSGNFLESPFKHVFYHLRLRLHKIRRKKLWVKRRVLGFISEVAGGLGRVKYQNGRRGPL